MDFELNQAYDLIKQGDTERAIAILETYIRANRDSDDAWWLYANAIEEPDTKRNALNNILRIGTNPERQAKVEYMLAQLDNPLAMPEQFATPAKKSGKSTGLKIFMGIGVLLGICACVALLGFGTLVAKMIYVPSDYDSRGNIAMGDTVSGVVDTQGDWDGYVYRGNAGEELIITVRSENSDFAPFIFLYGPDDTFIDMSDENIGAGNRLRESLPETGNYTVIVRTFFGLGGGEYIISVDDR
ncbi:MAG: hypothetical protein Q9P44_16895 [Anaerolineae bacterium]|nr:hypothetical protein [Anaerolineae bacterium]